MTNFFVQYQIDSKKEIESIKEEMIKNTKILLKNYKSQISYFSGKNQEYF